MEISPNTRIALDPNLRLRNDIDRIVILARPRPFSERDAIFAIFNPSQAIIIALMNGTRTLDQVGELWADLTNRPKQDGVDEVIHLSKILTSGSYGENKIIIEVDDKTQNTICNYNIEEFIIPNQNLNLFDRRLRKPWHITFLPTMYCPQNCIYCYAKTSKNLENDNISLTRIHEVFAEIANLGIEAIDLSGGDPFSHKNIFDIIEIIVSTGMAVNIPTKLGTPLEKLLHLRSIGQQGIQISLDSVDPEILDYMVGVKNHHVKMFQTFEDAKKAELTVRVNCVVTPFNTDGINDVIDYLGEMGNINRLIFTPYARSLYCHRDECFLSDEEFDRIQANIQAVRNLYPHMYVALSGKTPSIPNDSIERQNMWEKRAYCTGNRDGFIILPDGRVTACEELYDHPAFIMGDLKNQTIMEMWSSAKAMALNYPDQSLVDDGPCRSCPDFIQCHSVKGRCWRDVLKSYGLDRPHYPDPRCPLAPIGAARVG